MIRKLFMVTVLKDSISPQLRIRYVYALKMLNPKKNSQLTKAQYKPRTLIFLTTLRAGGCPVTR
ncbi:hypothetical protein KDH_51350 [Dictyobacter sp. S3.2.2.5]|uniref:Uncharacterized protein n=1 Tax=Dictyobacter halimunensis TaxID=3026934 RepID=A0ABQ6FVK9_9CHLR|nr:hypothetical protein KDH_51350 [Dictyobacter sp. S3.2.2.5]